MSPATAKSIKDVMNGMYQCFGAFHNPARMQTSLEELEKALHDFAENIKQDALEP